MRLTVRQNLRALAFPVALALIWAAFMPTAAWRCLDGTLCPSGGFMPHSSAMAAPPAPHSCCKMKPAAPSDESISPIAGCVLSGGDRLSVGPPTAGASLIDTNETALLISAPVGEIAAARSVERIILYADLPPPPQLDSNTGRSPPFAS